MTKHKSSCVPLTGLDHLILATLAYSEQFSFPLFAEEVYQRLISASFFNAAKDIYSKDQVISRLKHLENNGRLSREGELLRLRNVGADLNQKKSFQSQRCTKLRNSQKARASAKILLHLAIFFPWIRAVGVTGAVAAKSASINDDLDLLIITSSNTLWLVRFILLIISLILGKKRLFRAQKSINKDKTQIHADTWCFNIFLDESALKITADKHNLYTAYEVMQIDWLLDKEKLEQSFDLINSWVCEYLSWWQALVLEQKACQNKDSPQKNKGNQIKMINLISMIGIKNMTSIIYKSNNLFFNLERKSILKKNDIPIKNLKVNQAWLHDNSSYKRYLSSWKNIYSLACLTKNCDASSCCQKDSAC